MKDTPDPFLKNSFALCSSIKQVNEVSCIYVYNFPYRSNKEYLINYLVAATLKSCVLNCGVFSVRYSRILFRRLEETIQAVLICDLRII